MPNLMPQSIESEIALLGSILIDPEALLVAREIVTPDDFYREAHRQIAEAMWHLQATHQPIDLITLMDEMTKRGKLDEIGGMSTISALANNVPTSAHAEHYAQAVADASTRRRLIRFGSETAGIAYDGSGGDISALLGEVRALWHAIEQHARHAGDTRQQMVPGGVALDELLADVLHRMLPGERKGVGTGYLALDTHLQSFEPGELIYLIGRPGSGKTTLLQGIAMHNVAVCEAEDDGCVAWVSMEMHYKQVLNHIICAHTGVNTALWRSGFKRPDGTLARATYDRWRQGYDEHYQTLNRRLRIQNAAVTTADLRARLTRLVDEEGCRLALIDYLGLLKPTDPRAPRYQQVSQLSIDLKQMALELNIPIVAVVQMSRENMSRENKRPDMTDLRDSGQQEQDADFILAMHRPAYYDQDGRAAQDEAFKRFAEVLVLKAREGVADHALIPLRAELEYARFTAWPANQPWPHDPTRGNAGPLPAAPVSEDAPLTPAQEDAADPTQWDQSKGVWWSA